MSERDTPDDPQSEPESASADSPAPRITEPGATGAGGPDAAAELAAEPDGEAAPEPASAADAEPADETSTDPVTGEDVEAAAKPRGYAGVTDGAQAAGARRPPRRGGWLAAAAMVVAGVAALIAISSWLGQRDLESALDRNGSDLRLALDGTRADIDALGGDIGELGNRLASLEGSAGGERADLDRLAERLSALPGRLDALERRVAALQGGTFEASQSWLRSEAEYYLELANAELELRGRFESAISALERADATLVELGDPSFAPVRALIADELIALRAVPLPDIEGTAFTLSRLAGRVADLPFPAERPQSFPSEAPTLDDAEPGFARLWLAVKNALAGIISVERSDEPVAAVLSADERRLLRRQLALELALARVAAVSGEAELFRTSLTASREMLERNFDRDAADVEGAIELLGQLETFDIAPEAPDISGSLLRLRSLTSEDD